MKKYNNFWLSKKKIDLLWKIITIEINFLIIAIPAVFYLYNPEIFLEHMSIILKIIGGICYGN